MTKITKLNKVAKLLNKWMRGSSRNRSNGGNNSDTICNGSRL